MSKTSSRIKNLSRNKVSRLRLALAESQNHRCAFCQKPMFDYRIQNVTDFMKEHNISYGVTVKSLRLSIDHVDCHGSNSAENFVASHAWCNSEKGQREADEYFQSAQIKISKGNHYIHQLFNNGEHKRKRGDIVSIKGIMLPKNKFKDSSVRVDRDVLYLHRNLDFVRLLQDLDRKYKDSMKITETELVQLINVGELNVAV